LSGHQIVLLPPDGIYERSEFVIGVGDFVDSALQHFKEVYAAITPSEKPGAEPIQEDGCDFPVNDEAPGREARGKLGWVSVLNEKIIPGQLDGLHVARPTYRC
jgi:hypothetical protein